jgi:hypothetical protein
VNAISRDYLTNVHRERSHPFRKKSHPESACILLSTSGKLVIKIKHCRKTYMIEAKVDRAWYRIWPWIKSSSFPKTNQEFPGTVGMRRRTISWREKKWWTYSKYESPNPMSSTTAVRTARLPRMRLSIASMPDKILRSSCSPAPYRRTRFFAALLTVRVRSRIRFSSL